MWGLWVGQACQGSAWLALSDPGRGQPMSLGPLGWSIMSSDYSSPSEDHPSVSNVSTQSLVGVSTYRMSTVHDIHPGYLQAYQLNPMAPPLDAPSAIMHKTTPDFMTDLCSCLLHDAYLSTHMGSAMDDSVRSHSIGWTYGSSPLSAFTCSHVHPQSDSGPVIVRPCYIDRSADIHPGTNVTQVTRPCSRYA